MSQIVFTELEGEPVRWPYNQSVPIDRLKTLRREYKSINVSTTETAVIANTSTGTAYNVYGPNQIAQILFNKDTAKRINKIQLYGLKTGSPPNPLYAEIRQAVFSNDVVESLFPYAPDPYDIVVSGNIELPLPKILLTYYRYAHVGRISFRAKRVGSPSNITVKLIREDGYILYTGTITASSIPTDTYTTVTLDTPYDVRYLDDSYTVRLEVTGDASNYYLIQGLYYNTKTITTDIATEKPLVIIPTVLPAGKRIILVTMGHIGGGSYKVAKLFLRKADGTLLDYNWDVANNGIELLNSAVGGVIGFDPNAQANEIYLVNVKGGLNNYFIKLTVFNVDDGDTNSATGSIGAGATVVLAQKTTSLPAGKYVIIARVEIPGNGGSNYTIGAGTVRLKIGTTNVVSNEFAFTVSAYSGGRVTLVYAADLSANPTIAVEIYNPTTGAINAYVRWIAFKVSDYYYVDGVSTAVGTTDTTIANLSTTYTAGTKVMVIAACQGNNPFTFKIKMNNANEFAYPGLNTRLGVLLASHFYTVPADNPSFQVTAVATSTGYNAEAKLVVFSLPSTSLWTGYIFPTLYVKTLVPSDVVVASGSIAPASVGTTAAWITITLGSAVALRPNEYYAVVVYTIGGDASNYYVIHSGGSPFTELGELRLTSSNVGFSWSYDAALDLSIQLQGYVYQKIYYGSLPSPPEIPSIAVAINELKVKAQTSGTMEFTGFDDYTYTSSPVSSTSTSPTIVTVLSSTASRIRKYVRPMNVFEIWAAGVALCFESYYQTHAYYNNPTLTPRDIGFTELYLLRITAKSSQTIVILNGRAVGSVYLANSGDSFTAPSDFKIPVKKIEIFQGSATIDLIGVE
ncbi:MAG: hypothetical protein LZ168_04505 [Thaumarchaeota archaeon]|jgi:hypothetical protein|nr:hypothetical protein [Candidatus Geocrenenecus arthurdayi]